MVLKTKGGLSTQRPFKTCSTLLWNCSQSTVQLFKKCYSALYLYSPRDCLIIIWRLFMIPILMNSIHRPFQVQRSTTDLPSNSCAVSPAQPSSKVWSTCPSSFCTRSCRLWLPFWFSPGCSGLCWSTNQPWPSHNARSCSQWGWANQAPEIAMKVVYKVP